MATAVDTRTKILDAALGCFLEQGYEQTTVAKIRERSGVSNGALFHHFPTKDAIAAGLYTESIRSFQEGHWKILSERPDSFREAVWAIVRHHLTWVEGNRDQAKFLYQRGNLDWALEEAAELAELNRKLVVAYRAWLVPFIEAGELRQMSTLMFTAIVSGPAHSISQQWLGTPGTRPLSSYLDELAGAAWAGLAGQPHPTHSSELAHAAASPTRVRVQLIGADGDTLGETEVALPPPTGES